MKGELDWIVMQALDKDRTRRYESASAFAADIERYLNDEPVEACPPSATYRLRKLARRNKTTITTSGLVAVALIIGIIVSVWQAMEANDVFFEADNQRQNAERAAKLAQQNEEFSRQLVYAADVKMAAQAWKSGDVRRFTNLLDQHSQIAGKTDRRGFEWWYLRQFGTASFHNIATQTGGSCAVRYSPDGKYLDTGQHDGTVCIWDGHSFEPLATLRGHESFVRGIDFAPDGIRMASIGYDGMIRVWDLSEQKLIRRFQAHANHGYLVYFLMDGEVLASCGDDTSVLLWNASTGEAVSELEGNSTTAALDRSPDGRLLVSGKQDRYARVWDIETHKQICELDLGIREGVRCLASCLCFSPDGRFVAVGTNQNIIRLCDARTGKQIATFTGHEDDIQTVTFHPSGGLLASSDMAGVIRLWPLNSIRNVDSHDFGWSDKWPPYFQGHANRAWSLDFSPDGTRLVSASKDGTVRSWSGREQATQHIRETGDESNAVTFVSQGSELLIAGDNNIRVWSRQADEIRPFGEPFDETAYCVAVSPDGETCVTGHKEGIVRFWSRETGRLKKTLMGHEDDVKQIAFSPDGRLLVTGSWDGTAKLWDTASEKQVAVFHFHEHPLCDDVAFSPNGRLLAWSSYNDAMLFDVASQKRLHLLLGHENSANCVAFSPDGRLLATGSADRTIRIWNVDTGDVKHVISAHRDEIDSLAFSPDGRTIASGGGTGTIAFSHVETGRFLYDTKVGNDEVRCLQFSPDGKTLVAAVSEKGVILLSASFPGSSSPRLKSEPLSSPLPQFEQDTVVKGDFFSPLPLEENLVINGGAESGRTGWTLSRGEINSFVHYEKNNKKELKAIPNHGSRFFRGGNNSKIRDVDAILSQTIELVAGEFDIDRGAIRADMSASLGGYMNQPDRAIVQFQWKNSRNEVIRADTLPTVTNVSRKNTTMLLRRGLRNVLLPAETRKVTVVILALMSGGSNNDGYSDNISLSLHESRDPESQMVFEMKDGEDVTVSAVILGNNMRVTGQNVNLVLPKEINPTNGMVIRTK
jgi:WD40 repeat protein